MTADEIKGILSENYGAPYWKFFTELKESVYNHSRRIDGYAISISMDKGEGYTLAFEIKVDREDIGREIADPDKRRPFFEQCNEFYFVTPPGLFLKVDEVPEGCGLLEVTPNGLVRKKYAQQRVDLTYKPSFVASMVSRDSLIEKRKLFTVLGSNCSKEELENYISEEVRTRVARTKTKMKQDIYQKVQEENDFKYEKLKKVVSSHINWGADFDENITELENFLSSKKIERIKELVRQINLELL